MAQTPPIVRMQYAQKVSENFNERIVFHFESDTKQILVGDTAQTLDELLKVLDGERSITLSGEVTGTVKTDGHSNIAIETTVTKDGHEHTGATVKVDKAARVVVSAEDTSIMVSEITTDELNALSKVKSNIQDQLDDKVKQSETNGNIVVDGKELPVYVHPDIELEEAEELDPIELSTGTSLFGINELKIDEKGHLSKLQFQEYVMPQVSRFWVSTTEPTGQKIGDFWLETLNVEVESGAFYLQPAEEGANLADTMVVGAGTSGYFSLTDPVSGETSPAGIYNNYSLSEST